MEAKGSLPCSQEPDTGPCSEPDASNQLTPWSRGLHEKLVDTLRDTKCPSFYVTRRFINVFTTAHHWCISRTRCIQPTPSQSHLGLDFPSGLFRFSDENFVYVSQRETKDLTSVLAGQLEVAPRKTTQLILNSGCLSSKLFLHVYKEHVFRN
jgi:hypothetical protein